MNPFNKFSQPRKNINFYNEFVFCTLENAQYIFRLPFEWDTPIGYSLCIMIQIPILYLLADMYIFITLFATTLCIFVTDFVTDIEERLRSLNEIMLDQKMLIGNKQMEITQKLIDIIQFHSQTRE